MCSNKPVWSNATRCSGAITASAGSGRLSSPSSVSTIAKFSADTIHYNYFKIFLSTAFHQILFIPRTQIFRESSDCSLTVPCLVSLRVGCTIWDLSQRQFVHQILQSFLSGLSANEAPEALQNLSTSDLDEAQGL